MTGDQVSHGKIFTDSFCAQQQRKLYMRWDGSIVTISHQLLMSKYLGSAGKSCSTRSCNKDETYHIKLNSTVTEQETIKE